MADLLELGDRLGSDPLGGRVGRDELGMLALDRLELVVERVVGVIADLGIVEHVVAVRVIVDRLPELGDALGRIARLLGRGAHDSTHSPSSSAAGSTSRSNS